MKKNRKKISRRSFLKAMGAGGALVAGEPFLRPLGGFWAQEKSPIIIGHQCEYTGLLAGWGYWMDLTAKYAIKQINESGGIAGRTVEYYMEDTASDAATGARKIRALIQKWNADFILGAILTGPVTGSLPVAKELKTVYFMSSGADEVITKFGNRYTFIGNGVERTKITYGVPWVMKNLGKKVTFLVYDMGWGYSHVDGATPIIEKMGGTFSTSSMYRLMSKTSTLTFARLLQRQRFFMSLFRVPLPSLSSHRAMKLDSIKRCIGMLT